MSDSTTRHFESSASRAAAIVALQWLRERFPQARIVTHVLPSDEALIAVRVSVKNADGPTATGHGVAPGIVKQGEARLAQSQLQMLRMQLQPHFLFNTLHSISALMHKDVRRADSMVAALSDLLLLRSRARRHVRSPWGHPHF